MDTFTLKCVNNSRNTVDFCIYQKLKIEPQFVAQKKSVVWQHKVCNSKVTTMFSWENTPFFVGGKGRINQNSPFVHSIFSEADPSDMTKNSIVLTKVNEKYVFESNMSENKKNTLSIYTDSLVAHREFFVGLGMKPQSELVSSIAFEAQPNSYYEFTTDIDYYITYAKEYKQGQAINEADEKNAFKLRFPSKCMIVTLKNDNTFALRPDDIGE